MATEFIEAILQAGLTAVVRTTAEVVLLAYLLYQLFRVLRGRRAVPIGIGAGMLVGGYYLSILLGFHTIELLLAGLAPYAGIGLIIIFQSEIRAALRDIGVKFYWAGRSGRRPRFAYEDIVFAVSQLAHSRVGALIVIERETGLKTFVQSGVALDARLSSDLLVSIFQRTSPLHDGGVIIQGDHIAAAACFLPLTTNPELVSTLGTRHRAAIGLAEESDALVLVVSETDGRISIAYHGAIERGVSIDRLRQRMNKEMGRRVVAPPETNPDISDDAAEAVSG